MNVLKHSTEFQSEKSNDAPSKEGHVRLFLRAEYF